MNSPPGLLHLIDLMVWVLQTRGLGVRAMCDQHRCLFEVKAFRLGSQPRISGFFFKLRVLM